MRARLGSTLTWVAHSLQKVRLHLKARLRQEDEEEAPDCPTRCPSANDRDECCQNCVTKMRHQRKRAHIFVSKPLRHSREELGSTAERKLFDGRQHKTSVSRNQAGPPAAF